MISHYIAVDQAVLDGEIAALDEKGVARFELIQPRIAQSDPNSVAHLARSRPVVYFAFDLLYLNGYDLRQVALIERKQLLESLLSPTAVLRFSEHFPGAGEAMLQAAREAGLEGVVAKRAGSRYEPRRSREWLKLKIVERQEFIICGYTAGEREHFGALVLGIYDEGKLVWVGNAGTGFDQKTLAFLRGKLDPLITPQSPFPDAPKVGKDVTWVRPELVAEVKFANWTGDGKLRAPVYLGLRPDAVPRDAVREEAGQSAAPPKDPLLTTKQDEVSLKIDGKPLKFTNLNKIFYPAEGITKGDILNYYDGVAGLILPHLKDRPLSLKRYPNGITQQYFFQKDTPVTFAPWLRTEEIYSDHNEGPIRYVFAEDRASLLYLVNLGFVLSNSITLFCRLAIPFDRLIVILWHSPTLLITPTKVVLRTIVSLRRSLAKPCDCFDIILFNAVSVVVTCTEIELGRRVPLFRCLAKPRNRVSRVLGNNLPIEVTDTENVLRICVSLIRGFP